MWDQWVPVWVGGIRLHSTDSFRTQAGVARTELEGSVLSSFGNGLEGGSLPRLCFPVLPVSPSPPSWTPAQKYSVLLLCLCKQTWYQRPSPTQAHLTGDVLFNPLLPNTYSVVGPGKLPAVLHDHSFFPSPKPLLLLSPHVQSCRALGGGQH